MLGKERVMVAYSPSRFLKLTPLVFGGLVVLLGTTSTQAGFQWIPPQQAPAVTPPVVQPAPVYVAPPPLAPGDPLLLPGPLSPPPPVQATTVAPPLPPPVSREPLPIVTNVAPNPAPILRSTGNPALAPAPVFAPAPGNTPISLQGPAMKVKTIGSTEPLESAPPPSLAVPDPVVNFAPPPPPVYVAPSVIKRQRIIVPSDAPANAIEKAEGQGRVEISGFPGEADLNYTAQIPMPSADEPPVSAAANKTVETFVARNPIIPPAPLAPQVLAAPAPAPLSPPLPAPRPLPAGGVMISPNPLGTSEPPVFQNAPASAFISGPAPNITIAEGFGNDVPLALALQQILPSRFAYAFDPAINVGARVSWNGGRNWDVVIADMITPLGYSFVIQNNVVRIISGSNAFHYAPAPLAPLPPAAGVVPLPPVSVSPPVATLPLPYALEPAAGDENVTTTNVSRIHDVRRSNVIDPGAVTKASQPQGVIEKMQKL